VQLDHRITRLGFELTPLPSSGSGIREELPALMPRRAGATGLEEKPGAAFRLVDPDFNQAGRADVAMLVAKVVCFAQPRGKRLIVFAQLGQHVERLDITRIIIEHPLEAADLPDGAHRHAAQLADPFRDRVGHGKELLTLLVEHQVVVAEMGSAHVPVKILRLEIKRKDIGQDRVHRAGNVLDRLGTKVGGSDERS
jgi:hypothetical protein